MCVSRALKAKGILVKTFVIGMGIDEDMAAFALHWHLFRCGRSGFLRSHFVGAGTSVAQHFRERGWRTDQTNVPYTFTDVRTGEHNPRWVHTMLPQFTADTMYVDPLPTYDFTVHSCLPPTRLGRLEARCTQRHFCALWTRSSHASLAAP